jgi:hypothetical protein
VECPLCGNPEVGQHDRELVTLFRAGNVRAKAADELLGALSELAQELRGSISWLEDDWQRQRVAELLDQLDGALSKLTPPQDKGRVVPLRRQS